MNMISKDYFELSGVIFDTITAVKGGLVEVSKDYAVVTRFRKDEFIAVVKRSGFKISDIPRRKSK